MRKLNFLKGIVDFVWITMLITIPFLLFFIVMVLIESEPLDVPIKVQVPWDVNKGDFYKHFGYGSTSEDGNICVHNRHIYEEQGCKFAPIEVAAKFSKEMTNNNCNSNILH